MDDLVFEWMVQLDFFLENDLPVVITLPPLRSIDPIGCEGALDVKRCRDIQLQDDSIRRATVELQELNADRPGVSFIEVDSILCPQGNPCPEVIDGFQRNNASHLGEE